MAACAGSACLHATPDWKISFGRAGSFVWFTAVFQMPKTAPGHRGCSINICGIDKCQKVRLVAVFIPWDRPSFLACDLVSPQTNREGWGVALSAQHGGF